MLRAASAPVRRIIHDRSRRSCSASPVRHTPKRTPLRNTLQFKAPPPLPPEILHPSRRLHRVGFYEIQVRLGLSGMLLFPLLLHFTHTYGHVCRTIRSRMGLPIAIVSPSASSETCHIVPNLLKGGTRCIDIVVLPRA